MNKKDSKKVLPSKKTSGKPSSSSKTATATRTATATKGADPKTTDQYTKLITSVANAGCIHEQKSKAKELAAVTGMCLVQPYLDYTEDGAQGALKIKIWEYNSFLIDPYFRSPDMSDAQ
jgi:hypothetical protein